MTQIRIVRALLLAQAASLLAAAVLHTGALTNGPFDDAAYYETTFAIVLIVGLVTSLIRPPWTRTAALLAQGIALAGAFVGLYATTAGFGPSSTADVAYHLALISVLVGGLVVAWRLPASSPVPGRR
jgi:hypothetical protein